MIGGCQCFLCFAWTSEVSLIIVSVGRNFTGCGKSRQDIVGMTAGIISSGSVRSEILANSRSGSITSFKYVVLTFS